MAEGCRLNKKTLSLLPQQNRPLTILQSTAGRISQGGGELGGRSFVCPLGIHSRCWFSIQSLLLFYFCPPIKPKYSTVFSSTAYHFCDVYSACVSTSLVLKDLKSGLSESTWSEIWWFVCCLTFHPSQSSLFLSTVSYYTHNLILLSPLLYSHHPFSTALSMWHTAQIKTLNECWQCVQGLKSRSWSHGFEVRSQETMEHTLFDSMLGYHWYLRLKGNTSVSSEVGWNKEECDWVRWGSKECRQDSTVNLAPGHLMWVCRWGKEERRGDRSHGVVVQASKPWCYTALCCSQRRHDAFSFKQMFYFHHFMCVVAVCNMQHLKRLKYKYKIKALH